MTDLCKTPRRAALLAAALTFTASCGGKEKEPEFAAPPQDAGYDAQYGPAPTATAPPPPAATVTPLDPSIASALSTAILARATLDAPGMSPLAPMASGNVPEGQDVTSQVTLHPGKCYTVIGQAVPNVVELDVQVTSVPPLPALPPFVFAADNMTGLEAIIGAKKNCYKYPFNVPGMVNVKAKATRGSGPLAVQVFTSK